VGIRVSVSSLRKLRLWEHGTVGSNDLDKIIEI